MCQRGCHLALPRASRLRGQRDEDGSWRVANGRPPNPHPLAAAALMRLLRGVVSDVPDLHAGSRRLAHAGRAHADHASCGKRRRCYLIAQHPLSQHHIVSRRYIELVYHAACTCCHEGADVCHWHGAEVIRKLNCDAWHSAACWARSSALCPSRRPIFSYAPARLCTVEEEDAHL